MGGRDAPPQPTLRVENLAFEWPGRTGFSLSVASFEVAAGERVFLHGASGSGKSTLLSLICGILTPRAGTVEVDGVNVLRLSPARRDRFRAERIGVIFQMFNLLPYVSALDNVLLPLRFAPERRRRVAGRERRAALALTGALGLPDALVVSARAAELSVGQQQRVAVARALIGGPRLIVADEPTSALDAAAQDAFLDTLFSAARDVGAAVLMVSHDARLATPFDRTVSLASLLAPREAAEAPRC